MAVNAQCPLTPEWIQKLWKISSVNLPVEPQRTGMGFSHCWGVMCKVMRYGNAMTFFKQYLHINNESYDYLYVKGVVCSDETTENDQVFYCISPLSSVVLLCLVLRLSTAYLVPPQHSHQPRQLFSMKPF